MEKSAIAQIGDISSTRARKATNVNSTAKRVQRRLRRAQTWQFSFASDWLRERRGFSGPITDQIIEKKKKRSNPELLSTLLRIAPRMNVITGLTELERSKVKEHQATGRPWYGFTEVLIFLYRNPSSICYRYFGVNPELVSIGFWATRFRVQTLPGTRISIKEFRQKSRRLRIDSASTHILCQPLASFLTFLHFSDSKPNLLCSWGSIWVTTDCVRESYCGVLCFCSSCNF